AAYWVARSSRAMTAACEPRVSSHNSSREPASTPGSSPRACFARKRCPSSPAPDEQSGHRVVPDHAHQRAGKPREPPDRFLVEDRERDADIGEQSDAADQIEQQQTAQDRKSLQPLVAIGEKI